MTCVVNHDETTTPYLLFIIMGTKEVRERRSMKKEKKIKDKNYKKKKKRLINTKKYFGSQRQRYK
jgi:hypothetical protein